jgi:hypothetical protein
MSNVKQCAAMSSSQGTCFYRTFIARPAIRVVTIRRGGCYRSSDDHRVRQTVAPHYMKQFSRRKSSMVGRVSNNFSHSNYSNFSSTDLEVEDSWTRTRRYSGDMSTAKPGRVSATALNPILSPAQYTQEQVQSHLLASPYNTSLQFGSTGVSGFALRSTPTTWVAPSRTVKVAFQAVSKTKIQSSSASGLPQYAKRVGKISAQNQSSPLLLARQVSDAGGEAWERAAQKLGLFAPTKAMSASAYKTGASLSEVEPAKAYMPSSLAVDTKYQPEPYRLVGSRESKSEVFKVVSPRRQDSSEPLWVSDPVSELKSEPANFSEKVSEESQSRSHAEEPEVVKTKRTSTKKAVADSSVDESKPKPRARKEAVSAQPEEKGLPEANVTDDSPVLTLASVESSNEDLVEERQSYPNESVMVIDSVEKATMVVEQLMGEYKDLVHACDTEVLFQ